MGVLHKKGIACRKFEGRRKTDIEATTPTSIKRRIGMAILSGNDGIVLKRRYRRGTGWPAQHHVKMVGTTGNEVRARTDGTEQHEVEGIGGRVGCVPHGGTSVARDADAEVAQMGTDQVGPAALPLIVHMSVGVGPHLHIHHLILRAGLHLLAVDNLRGTIDDGRQAGIIGDVHHGILGNLGKDLLAVQVLVLLLDVNAELIAFLLAEQRIAIDILVAIVGVVHDDDRVVAFRAAHDGHLQLAEGTVFHARLRHVDNGLGTVLTHELGGVHIF